MGTVVIVVVMPGLQFLTGIVQRNEFVDVEKLITQPPVEYLFRGKCSNSDSSQPDLLRNSAMRLRRLTFTRSCRPFWWYQIHALLAPTASLHA